MSISCAVPNCQKPRRRNSDRRPWCDQHYQRWRLYGNPEEPHHGWPDKTCSVDGCDIKVYALGLCNKHWQRHQRYGDVNFVKKRVGAINRTTNQGYVFVKRPGHPNRLASGWVAEHRVVMSEMLGRPLLPHENIHHKNGNRADNRPENLELWIKKQPCGQRVEDVVTWAKEILALYGPLVGDTDEREAVGEPSGDSS